LKCKHRVSGCRKGRTQGHFQGLKSEGDFLGYVPLLLMLHIKGEQHGSRWPWWQGAGLEQQGGAQGHLTVFSTALGCWLFHVEKVFMCYLSTLCFVTHEQIYNSPRKYQWASSIGNTN
jgi:hypothetical protein